MRESVKDERVAYEEKIRKLRKGRMDLLKAYKQQIILIDNLRRQNVCLEKAKALEIAEKEFLKVLDWNFTDKWLACWLMLPSSSISIVLCTTSYAIISEIPLHCQQ